jgi:hypothetical protein
VFVQEIQLRSQTNAEAWVVLIVGKRTNVESPPRERPGHSTWIRYLAVVKITEPVEAILQLVGAAALLLSQDTAGRPPAPLEMWSQICVPTRTTISAPEPIVRVGLNLRDACIDFATRTLAFNVTTPIVAAKTEREIAIAKADGLGIRSHRRDENGGRSQANRNNTHL